MGGRWSEIKLGDNLKRLLKEQGYTQTKFADVVGCTGGGRLMNTALKKDTLPCLFW